MNSRAKILYNIYRKATSNLPSKIDFNSLNKNKLKGVFRWLGGTEDMILVENIPFSLIDMKIEQAEGVIRNLIKGRLSETKDYPIMFYYISENGDQLNVDDGNHRLFQRWLSGHDAFDAYIYSGTYHGYLAPVWKGEEKFDFSEDSRGEIVERIGDYMMGKIKNS